MAVLSRPPSIVTDGGRKSFLGENCPSRQLWSGKGNPTLCGRTYAGECRQNRCHVSDRPRNRVRSAWVEFQLLKLHSPESDRAAIRCADPDLGSARFRLVALHLGG